jgi:predicted histone-like DNA-binding protein
MSIHYRIEENSLKENSYYARVIRADTVTLTQLITNIAAKTSLSPSDINGVVTALIEEVTQALVAGNTAEIDGLVSFVPTLTGSFETQDYVVTRANAQLKISTQENQTLRGNVAAQATYIREPSVVKIPAIASFFDVATQTYDQYTPGSIIRLEGENLKFNLAKPDEGVFVHASVPEVRLTVYSMAGPKRIDALIPADLTGNLTVLVRTRYTPEGDLRQGTYHRTVTKVT